MVTLLASNKQKFKNAISTFFIFYFLCINMATAQKFPSKNFLKKIIKSNPDKFENIRKNLEKYKVQIIYTQINRNKDNQPIIKNYYYNIQKKQYFYPASTVKLPIVLLALEKLNTLKIKDLDKNTNFFTYQARPPQTETLTDSTAENGLPSVAHYAKKVLITSDNEGSNRLYEFVGQDAVNQKLLDKNFQQTLILHRLAAPQFDEEANRYSNPFVFKKNDSVIYEEKEKYVQKKWKQKAKNTTIGKKYQNGEGKIIDAPLNFERRNFMSLKDIHKSLQSVIFPETLPKKERFNLTTEDYSFLYRYMSMLPKQSDFPKYDLPDNYAKYMLGNTEASKEMPKNIKIFNKVGMAFGFLIDNAYVIDTEKKVEFMLSAVIYVNENEILNDDKYEYDTIGFPFFKNLFDVIYEYETKRKRIYLPDFKKFIETK
ncbi:MAG: hypothetical protein EAZ20_11560 [Bacteroidetes bacterium]|nr:MAG: hypothetical protein EAZ20_11560 [Bacteroidota bacterium]